MIRREIGFIRGHQPGPLLICLAGVHGNEPAGVAATETLMQMLHSEFEKNPGYGLNGSVLGVRGNLQAMAAKKRFLENDLNRMLTPDTEKRISGLKADELRYEDLEFSQLTSCIEERIAETNPSKVLILDLHTTTAEGSAFSIAGEDEASIHLAGKLNVPLILGIAHTLKGTTLDYFSRPEHGMKCIVFEAGQHGDPQSITRTLHAILHCMEEMKMLPEDRNSLLRQELSTETQSELPGVTKTVYHYKIKPGEVFTMKNGYKNFDRIAKGEILAMNEAGPVISPEDGWMLMPKYQPQGDDGFFIVKAVM